MTSRLRRSVTLTLALVVAASLLSGCMYARHRTDDFLDVFDLGLGVTAESQHSWLPPTFGVLAEAGPIALGGITHNGYVAELDGRGAYAGPDSRSRLALLYIQGWQHQQDYVNGCMNFYKDIRRSRAWHEHMRDMAYVKKLFWAGTVVPAKDLIHDDPEWRWEVFPLRRGWQYWETIAVEAGISEPFLTHAGLYARVGLDPSEILDFVLGFLTIDLKRDDLRDYVRVVQEPPPPPAPEPQVVEREVVRTVTHRVWHFPDVLFNYDDSTLTAEGSARVDEIVRALRGNEITEMAVTGHCCDLGTPEYNYELGMRRASTVAEALRARGVDFAGMEIVSMGEDQPRVPNTSEEARRLNRRVEVEVSYYENGPSQD